VARAAAALACFLTSDRRPRLAAPEPEADTGGADLLAAVVKRAPSSSSGLAPVAAGADAGTSAASAAGACAGGDRGVNADVRASVSSVVTPSAGTSEQAVGVEAAAVPASDEILTGGDTFSPAAANSFPACV